MTYDFQKIVCTSMIQCDGKRQLPEPGFLPQGGQGGPPEAVLPPPQQFGPKTIEKFV